MGYLVSTYGCSPLNRLRALNGLSGINIRMQPIKSTEGVKWAIWYNIRMQLIKPTEGVKWAKPAPLAYVIDVMRNYRIYRITNYSHLKQKDYEHDFFS